MAGLEQRLRELTRRVEQLERNGPRNGPKSGPKSEPGSEKERAGRSRPGAEGLALVEQLRSRQGGRFRRAGIEGAVVYAGAARFGERQHLWVKEQPLPDLVDLDPGGIARVLGALGHPARLLLLRALLRQPCSRQQLQEALGLASVGQLYHHLKELLAAGLVAQVRRSQYEIAADRVVPLLVMLGAASEFVGAARDGGDKPAVAGPPGRSRG